MEYRTFTTTSTTTTHHLSIHFSIPTKVVAIVHAGSWHSTTFKVITLTVVVLTVITAIIILLIYLSNKYFKKYSRSILPYQHSIVTPFISTTATTATIKSKKLTCSDSSIQKQFSCIISLPPKIQRIESFRPISLPITSIPFGQEVIRDPLFSTFIKEISTYAFRNTHPDALVKTDAVISCVTNNNFALKTESMMQPIYLLEKELSKRTSFTNTVGSNQSIQSLQWIGFTENMDRNYLKTQRLDITNALHCYPSY